MPPTLVGGGSHRSRDFSRAVGEQESCGASSPPSTDHRGAVPGGGLVRCAGERLGSTKTTTDQGNGGSWSASAEIGLSGRVYDMNPNKPDSGDSILFF